MCMCVCACVCVNTMYVCVCVPNMWNPRVHNMAVMRDASARTLKYHHHGDQPITADCNGVRHGVKCPRSVSTERTKRDRSVSPLQNKQRPHNGKNGAGGSIRMSPRPSVCCVCVCEHAEQAGRPTARHRGGTQAHSAAPLKSSIFVCACVCVCVYIKFNRKIKIKGVKE